jgi:hypothetical protein
MEFTPKWFPLARGLVRMLMKNFMWTVGNSECLKVEITKTGGSGNENRNYSK